MENAVGVGDEWSTPVLGSFNGGFGISDVEPPVSFKLRRN
jgi:hypothetical protein